MIPTELRNLLDSYIAGLIPLATAPQSGARSRESDAWSLAIQDRPHPQLFTAASISDLYLLA